MTRPLAETDAVTRWRPRLETVRGSQSGTRLPDLETSVVESDLDREDVQSLDDVHARFARLTGGPAEQTEQELAALVDGDTALLRLEYGYKEDAETREESTHHLVATADGVWKLVG